MHMYGLVFPAVKKNEYPKNLNISGIFPVFLQI